MKYKIIPSSRFKKDLKQLDRRGWNLNLLSDTIKLLSEGTALPPKYKDHKLSGDFLGCRECHITPDWILIYEVRNDVLMLYLTRTGTHSDIFKR